MAMISARIFEHDGEDYAIRVESSLKSGNIEVSLLHDSTTVVMKIDRNSTVYVIEGRYGHLNLFDGRYEFSKAPICTLIPTLSDDYLGAVEFVAKHYLATKEIKSCLTYRAWSSKSALLWPTSTSAS